MPGQAVATVNDKQWSVDVASTYTELVTGLSGVASLPPSTGMLFDLGYDQSYIEIDMSQMLFPLDIIFINSTQGVVGVIQNAQPGEEVYFEATTTPGARYFLEVNAGEADGVGAGDSVTITGYESAAAFDLTAVVSFAIPLMVLGFVCGLAGGMAKLMGGSSSSKSLSSGTIPTEEQIRGAEVPIPFTPVKRLERDDVLYVTEKDIPHPIYGYAKSHKEYSVIDLRGYRKGYEPRLEIRGIYTPNPTDTFRLQNGHLPPYQPTTTGDKLLAEMRRMGVHKAYRIAPVIGGSSSKRYSRPYLTNWQYGGYSYVEEDPSKPEELWVHGMVDYADPNEVIAIAESERIPDISLAGGFWEAIGYKGYGEKVTISESKRALAKAREHVLGSPSSSPATKEKATVRCPLCEKMIEIGEYDSVTRSDALKKHLEAEHTHHSPWLTPEQRKGLQEKYGAVAVRWAEEATRPGDMKGVETAAEYYFGKLREVFGLGHLSPDLSEEQMRKLRDVLGLTADVAEVLKIHRETGYIP